MLLANGRGSRKLLSEFSGIFFEPLQQWEIERMARKRHQRSEHERIHPWPEPHPAPEDVAEKVSYVGSSEHKDYESVAGPPALRSDAARCDPRYTDFSPITAALREAIRRRCSGAQFEGSEKGE